MSLSDYYNKDAALLTRTEQTDELGIDFSSSWAALTTIKCALETLGKNERFIEGTEKVFATHRMYCAADTTIDETYRVTISSKTYKVRSVENPMEMDRHLEVLLEYQGL